MGPSMENKVGQWVLRICSGQSLWSHGRALKSGCSTTLEIERFWWRLDGHCRIRFFASVLWFIIVILLWGVWCSSRPFFSDESQYSTYNVANSMLFKDQVVIELRCIRFELPLGWASTKRRPAALMIAMSSWIVANFAFVTMYFKRSVVSIADSCAPASCLWRIPN